MFLGPTFRSYFAASPPCVVRLLISFKLSFLGVSTRRHISSIEAQAYGPMLNRRTCRATLDCNGMPYTHQKGPSHLPKRPTGQRHVHRSMSRPMIGDTIINLAFIRGFLQESVVRSTCTWFWIALQFIERHSFPVPHARTRTT